MPRSWMAVVHAWLGLGALPETPLVGFLARSTSFLYALHGAVLLLVSCDLGRYGRLTAFLATAALLQASST